MNFYRLKAELQTFDWLWRKGFMMKNESAEKKECSSENPANEEIQAAKKVIASLIIAMKNFGLYPDNHINCQKATENVKASLDEFFRSHSYIRFFVEKDQILFQTRVIYQETSNDANPASVLFRDGIQWLEFQKNIELKEIIGFLKILKQYKTLQENSEGDVVTALWEENFPHISHEAKDVFWEAEPIIDFSTLNMPPKKQDIQNGEEEGESEEKRVQRDDPKTPSSLADPSLDHSLWQLTPKELKTLRRMVYLEENRDGTNDVVDVLLVILEEQQKEKDFEAVLVFLREEFENTLEKGDFQIALKLLKQLNNIRETYETAKPWVIPLTDNFFREISGHQVLGIIQYARPCPEEEQNEMKAFWQILRLLDPAAIPTIGDMLLEASSEESQRMCMNIIGTLASRDIEPLAQLVMNHSEEPLLLKMILILRRLRGNRPVQILFRLTHHSSESVRKEAIKALVNQHPNVIKRLFLLIEDQDDSIRQLMFELLGQHRSQTTEELFLDYLEKRQFRRTDNQHILDCYRTLGKCGSSLSVLFLQNVLLDQGWKSIVGTDSFSLERQGAATALAELKTNEAEETLKKASRSLFPGIRQAYQKAVEGKHDG